MATVPKRPLTANEKESAKRLKEAWEKYKSENKGASQAWLGQQTRLGSQGLIGQYLNGEIPLNLKALLAICNVIAADPKVISPELTEMMTGADDAAPTFFDSLPDPAPVDALEVIQLIALYAQSSERGKRQIFLAAEEAEKLPPPP